MKFFYDRTIKMWPFNTGDCLIEVTAWAGFTVVHKARQNRGHDVSFEPNSNIQNHISSSVWMRKKTFQQGVGIFRKTFWNIVKRKTKNTTLSEQFQNQISKWDDSLKNHWPDSVTQLNKKLERIGWIVNIKSTGNYYQGVGMDNCKI